MKSKELKYNVKNLQLQSVTVVYNMNMSVNLNELSKLIKCWYEPEIFPEMRISKYDQIVLFKLNVRRSCKKIQKWMM